jgi:DNA-binding helix-hairpin-helix protein with protein kinase domain
VTEYQLHRLACPWCHETNSGQLSPGVPQSQAGPRLVALFLEQMAARLSAGPVLGIDESPTKEVRQNS